MRPTRERRLAWVSVAVLVLAGCRDGAGAVTAGRSEGSSQSTVAETSKSGKKPPTETQPSAPVGDPSAAGVGAPTDTPVSCPPGNTPVSDSAGLVAALAGARPGSVIELADGSYPGHFVAAGSGTTAQPIWLCGGPGAVIDGGDIRSAYAFHLDHAHFWRLVGFTVQGGQKGVVVDGSSHCVLQSLNVSGSGDEAIHLRSATSDCVVRGNTVSRTGLRRPKFGEGIYIGSAVSNWPQWGADGGPDRSDRNLIVDNRISATTSEAVDIKEGTSGGVLLRNTFDESTGLTAADSWVDVKGNNWLIEANTGTGSPTDGFQVHKIVGDWGQGNVFRDNTGNVGGSGYGINLAGAPDNFVYCSNRFTAAPKGLSNVTCR